MDAPSNFSDSVSSMIRLLISSRIIAARADVEYGLLWKNDRLWSENFVKFYDFSDSFPTFRASVFRFRIPAAQDPATEACPLCACTNSIEKLSNYV